MTSSLLIKIICLFIGLFILGTLACLPAYHWKMKLFFASRLWIKIYWWIPIFVVFCTLLYVRTWGAWIVVVLLTFLAGREIMKRQMESHWYVWAYYCLFVLSLLYLPSIFIYFKSTAIPILISICFASVLSDVCAFFAGTYAGKHHLPAFINARKSYEGVAGQIVGAVLGLGLVSLLPGIAFHLLFALALGTASALGDIVNSVMKRAGNIPDWGNTIPGHGGVLDRFASLSLAFAAGYWVMRVVIK
jgi:CDP-diglyceride synthetase